MVSLSRLIRTRGTASLLSWSFISLGLIPLFWLITWSIFNESARGGFSALAFVGFIIAALSLFKDEIMKPKESLSEASLGFVAFLILGLIVTFFSRSGFSIFNIVIVPTQYMLSSITAQLPYFWSTYLTTMAAPIAEELIFLITIPAIISLILMQFAKVYQIFNEKYVRLALIIVPTSLLFAYFHVGNAALIYFIWAAIIFRSVQIVLYDTGANKTVFGAIGFHMGINIGSSVGLLTFISIMLSEPIGYVLLAFFISLFYISFLYILRKK